MAFPERHTMGEVPRASIQWVMALCGEIKKGIRMLIKGSNLVSKIMIMNDGYQKAQF